MHVPEAMQTKNEFGREAEDLASDWLMAKPGWCLLTRNYRCRMGEIDLILEESLGDGLIELVFAEVRARSPGGWPGGVESVDWKKRRRLTRAASRFLWGYRGPATGVRFDILAWDGKLWTHVRNAWFT